MDKGSIKDQREQSGTFRKSHDFTVMKLFQPGNDNSYAIWRCNDIQNWSRYLVSYHHMIQYQYIAQLYSTLLYCGQFCSVLFACVPIFQSNSFCNGGLHYVLLFCFYSVYQICAIESYTILMIFCSILVSCEFSHLYIIFSVLLN